MGGVGWGGVRRSAAIAKREPEREGAGVRPLSRASDRDCEHLTVIARVRLRLRCSPIILLQLSFHSTPRASRFYDSSATHVHSQESL